MSDEKPVNSADVCDELDNTIHGKPEDQAKLGQPEQPKPVPLKRLFQIIPGVLNRAIYVNDAVGAVVATIDTTTSDIGIIPMLLRDLADEVERQLKMLAEHAKKAAEEKARADLIPPPGTMNVVKERLASMGLGGFRKNRR